MISRTDSTRQRVGFESAELILDGGRALKLFGYQCYSRQMSLFQFQHALTDRPGLLWLFRRSNSSLFTLFPFNEHISIHPRESSCSV